MFFIINLYRSGTYYLHTQHILGSISSDQLTLPVCIWRVGGDWSGQRKLVYPKENHKNTRRERIFILCARSDSVYQQCKTAVPNQLAIKLLHAKLVHSAYFYL